MKEELVKEANGLRGCLAHLRTATGRRRYGTDMDEDKFEMFDVFASDEAKITSSKAYRLLAQKTQVLTMPDNPLVRTRQSHVKEVGAVNVVIADMLGLNSSLARAISEGHDIGHVPFGHQGEHHLAKLMGRKEFCHEILGPIVTQKIERKGKGLNLTYETLEGMMCHSGSRAREGMTQEAWVVRYGDKIAYLFADYNDMLKRIGNPISPELRSLMDEFGQSHRERTTTAMAALIIESASEGRVSFEKSEWGQKFALLRKLMMEIYPRITRQDMSSVIDPVLEFLDELKMSDKYLMFALLTDKDVKFLSEQKFMSYDHLRNTALWERLEYLPKAGDLDLCNPYLDW